jgi:hypothetical protein
MSIFVMASFDSKLRGSGGGSHDSHSFTCHHC